METVAGEASTVKPAEAATVETTAAKASAVEAATAEAATMAATEASTTEPWRRQASSCRPRPPSSRLSLSCVT
jgi:hypothetical protein